MPVVSWTIMFRNRPMSRQPVGFRCRNGFECMNMALVSYRSRGDAVLFNASESLPGFGCHSGSCCRCFLVGVMHRARELCDMWRVSCDLESPWLRSLWLLSLLAHSWCLRVIVDSNGGGCEMLVLNLHDCRQLGNRAAACHDLCSCHCL